MPRSFRHPNGLIGMRIGSGRFRAPVMADVGLGADGCPNEACRAVITWEPYESDGRFVKPVPAPTACAHCGASLAKPAAPEEAVSITCREADFGAVTTYARWTWSGPFVSPTPPPRTCPACAAPYRAR